MVLSAGLLRQNHGLVPKRTVVRIVALLLPCWTCPDRCPSTGPARLCSGSRSGLLMASGMDWCSAQHPLRHIRIREDSPQLRKSSGSLSRRTLREPIRKPPEGGPNRFR